MSKHYNTLTSHVEAPQKIKDGVVKIKLIEARIGYITLEGNQYTKEKSFYPGPVLVSVVLGAPMLSVGGMLSSGSWFSWNMFLNYSCIYIFYNLISIFI